jgi:hypothetical protein
LGAKHHNDDIIHESGADFNAYFRQIAKLDKIADGQMSICAKQPKITVQASTPCPPQGCWDGKLLFGGSSLNNNLPYQQQTELPKSTAPKAQYSQQPSCLYIAFPLLSISHSYLISYLRPSIFQILTMRDVILNQFFIGCRQLV